MADSPKEAEAGQALFCSIADFVGKTNISKVLNLKMYPKYTTFKKAKEDIIESCFTKIKTPGISLKQIEDFMIKYQSWYESSVTIAVKLITGLSAKAKQFGKVEAPKWQDFIYVRGAKPDKNRSANTMENIAALFEIANTNDKQFGDINKWNPADIFYVSDNGREAVKDELDTLKARASRGSGTVADSFDFGDLNKLMNGLVASGDLLPLSLKKAGKEATLHKYNFNRAKEEKELADIEYYGVSDWSKKYTTGATRDIKIYFNKDMKQKIKIRHDPHTDNLSASRAIKVEIEVTGAGARGGSLNSISILGNILGRVDKTLQRNFLKNVEAGLEKYKKAIAKLNTEYSIKPGEKSGAFKQRPKAKTGPTKGKSGSQQYEMYKDDRIELSGTLVLDEIMPLLYNWFKSNENGKKKRLNTKLLQKFVEYTSSRSPQSGKFVIAK